MVPPTAADAGYRTWDGWLGFGGFVLDDAVENAVMDFRDRIVRLDRVPASQIENAPWNMRRHPQSQKDALRGSFEELGCFKPLDVYVTDEGMYRLIDGEARRNLIEADVSPDQLIPISVTDLSESEAKKALLIADPLSSLAETDSAALESLMRDVQIADEALAAMVAGMAEEAGMFDVPEGDAPVLPDGDRSPFQQMTFTLHDSQAEQVKAAIDKAKSAGFFDGSPNENSNGNALARIAEAYLGTG